MSSGAASVAAAGYWRDVSPRPKWSRAELRWMTGATFYIYIYSITRISAGLQTGGSCNQLLLVPWPSLVEPTLEPLEPGFLCFKGGADHYHWHCNSWVLWCAWRVTCDVTPGGHNIVTMLSQTVTTVNSYNCPLSVHPGNFDGLSHITAHNVRFK